MLVLVIVLTLLSVVGCVWAVRDHWYNISSGLTATLSLCILVMTLTFWCVQYFEYRSKIRQFKAFEVTLENSRKAETEPIERAAMQTKIVEYNEWLANAQFYNSLLINCVPDEVDQLEPIK